MKQMSLHPLARQAVIASANPECAGWAQGMTQYLAHANPFSCVEWALNFLLPFADDNGKQDDVVLRSASVLQQVLANPSSAVLAEVESAAWTAWHARSVTKNGNIVARLLWAAMGAVELVRPSWMHESDLAERGDPSVDLTIRAKDIVSEQSATALHLRAYDSPLTPTSAAQSFTNATTFSKSPSVDREDEHLEWQWCDLRYDVYVRRSHDGTLYLEYIDSLGDGALFSGPFASRPEIDAVLSLLKFTPKSIRLVPIS